jgi:Golgi nucleoside diphosphatase
MFWNFSFCIASTIVNRNLLTHNINNNNINNDNLQQGTRLHIYEWKKRFLLDEDDLVEQSEGKLLSYPTSNNRWTDKYTPGLDAFGTNLVDNPDHLEEAMGNYLGALLDFAREVLRDKKDEWHTYPIYLKATGGLRTLPQPQRIQLIDCVRKLFHDKTFNPFDFENERARVISGEEEAIYGWVGVNFGA